MPHTINVGGIRPQGAAWTFVPPYLITFQCYDEAGNLIDTYYQESEAGAKYDYAAPEIPHHELVRYESDATSIDKVDAHATVNTVYRRNSYAITLRYTTIDTAIDHHTTRSHEAIYRHKSSGHTSRRSAHRRRQETEAKEITRS